MIKAIPYSENFLKQYLEIVPKLWDDVEVRELLEIVEEHQNEDGYVILALDDDKVVGFLNSTIHQDYVEGSDDKQTGYVEGIYVLETYRKQNVAKLMFEHLLEYYKQRNIKSIGSDAFVDNLLSDKFHKAIGFKEVSINRHYIYKIKE